MKASDQFKLFYPFFELEEERYKQLTDRANIYLSIASGLTLFAGIHVEGLEAMLAKHWMTITIAGICGLLVLLCLLATVLSLNIYPYKTVVDIKKMVFDIDEKGWSDEDVHRVMLASLAKATHLNRGYNDLRATKLKWAVVFLAGTAMSFVALTVTSAVMLP